MYGTARHIRESKDPSLAIDRALGCCWTLQTEDPRLYEVSKELDQANLELSERGSAAMWESYCRDAGARIEVRLNRLLSLLAESLPAGRLYHGRVVYKPEGNWNYALSQQDPAWSLFAKRIAFRHEAEYRFIFFPEDADGRLIYVHFLDFYDLIDEVLIAPPAASRRWVARTLYNLVVNSTSRLDRGINHKNGRHYCRISQLYGDVSQDVGHGGMD